MKSLVDTVHRCGFYSGIHDQYRDYYFDAKTLTKNMATRLPDGTTIPAHKRCSRRAADFICAAPRRLIM